MMKEGNVCVKLQGVGRPKVDSKMQPPAHAGFSQHL